ncbi:uncharacterized protein LOC132741437 [Ruditapes philippinarum]|uniref:uncharacterized protein LOC132741437 n=1 Tax=Ruditapes philippinarum TaxID=129788 RepID=UPI00295B18FA|nr:uncharacterized protein LOC132741437 [Ruditapes philippinarum]
MHKKENISSSMKVTILDGNESPGDASVAYKEYIEDSYITKLTTKFVKQGRRYGDEQEKTKIIHSLIQGVSETEVGQRRQKGELVEQGLDIDVILNKEEKITRETLREMRDDIVLWIKNTKESIKCLRELADEIEDLFKKTSKAKIGGSAASIAGGIVAIVGFGLSFVTFGTSLILTIAGGVVAGAGGVTTGAASVVNLVKSSTKTKAAEEAINKYNEQSDKIKMKCIELSQGIEDIDSTIPEWVRFWGKLTQGCASTAVNASWSVVGKTIINSLKLSGSLAEDASNAGKTLFRVAGTAARGAHIAGVWSEYFYFRLTCTLLSALL